MPQHRDAPTPSDHITVPARAPSNRWGLPLDAVLWPLFLLLATATQLGFKVASKPLEALDFGPQWLAIATGQPAFAAAVAGYIATFVVWIAILQRTALSVAFLLTALVYVTVTLGSALWLGEHLNPWQLAGIVIIFAGIALLGSVARPAPLISGKADT